MYDTSRKEPLFNGVVYRFGLFVLDVSALTLTRNGIRIRLQEQPLQLLALLRMKRNRNSYACGKWGQHGADNPQAAMQIDATPSDQTRLNEKQSEPERKNQSVEMQKQGKRASAEQSLQVVGAGKAGEND